MRSSDWSIRCMFPLLVAVLSLASVFGCAQSAPPAPTPTWTRPAEATKPPAPAPTKAAETTEPAVKASPQSLVSVKLADVKSTISAPFRVAEAKGYFKEQGLDANFESVAGAAAVAAFLATGQLDIASGAMGAGFFNAINRGAQVRIVGPLSLEPPMGGGSTGPLLVRKELMDKGEVQSVKDLKGRTVAMNTRSGISEYRLHNVLKQSGMSLGDVNIVTMDFPDQLVALQNRAIDAAISTQPHAPQAVASGIAKILVDETLPGKMAFTIQYSPKFIQERPDAAKRFMVAVLKAMRDLQDKGMLKPDIIDVVSKATGQKPEVLKISVLPVFDPDGKIQEDFIQEQQQFFKDVGLLEYQELIPTGKIVDDTFVKYAVQQLGPYKK
ncbi:MAG: ABC transporter substrate-binding protein [Chloroflexi bacterium]|nr:ABC transporter substrate-binding protein [Chloroflexota bacterium]